MKYDVVVIGAGPAGSTAAKFLSEKEVKVLLLDKSTFPRDKPCGGGLPARVIKRYKYLEQNNLIDSYSSEVSIHSSSLKHKIDLQKNEPIVAMIRRDKFDADLVNLAAQKGAVFTPETSIQSIHSHEEKIEIALADGTKVESRYLIAADGMWSSIGKQFNLQINQKNIGMCILEEYPLQTTALNQLYGEKRRVHIHLNILGVAGYGWVFPKHDCVNIGICEFRQGILRKDQPKNLKKLFEQYLNILRESKLIPTELHSENPKGGVFPTFPIERTTQGRIVFCGDAAGMTNPLTGEGIYSAMVSGEIAAGVISEALETGKKETLQRYQSRWKTDFGNDNRWLFRWSQRWGLRLENVVRLFGKDEQLIDIAMKHIMTQESIRKYQWKLGWHFFSVYLKDRFGLK